METVTPSSCNAATMARADPPAPSTSAGPALRFTPEARAWAMNPHPSVFRPVIFPSRKIKVFTAPARRAESSTTSQISNAASLCGWVTFAPWNPTATSPRTPVTKSSARIPNGT